MATIYKYYINDKQYEPINTGGFTFNITLVQEAGSYQYVKELDGSINFKDAAYEYILLHDEEQKITLTVKEFCGEGTFVVWDAYFTRRDCKFFPDRKMIEIHPKQDSLFNCLIDNYSRGFNFLEATTVVDTTYLASVSKYEYKVLGTPVPLQLGWIEAQHPFWGTILCQGSHNFSPIGGFFKILAREVKTTYCQNGEPQAPSGIGWQLYYNNCAAKNLSKWYRLPIPFTDPAVCTPNHTISFNYTNCLAMPCTPAPPTLTSANENWHLMDTYNGILTAPAYLQVNFWIDLNTIPSNTENINNGRTLVDVIDLGLNKHCPTLDLQSEFLTSPVNPVTGNSPSSTEGIQFHAISDVKDPDATEPATREETTLKEILESYISAKLNCYWRVDEGTNKLVIEHYNDLYASASTTDLTLIESGKFTELKNSYVYDNSNTPKAEEFPSMDSSIDFTGMDINFDNASASGVKSYLTYKFYSEIETILTNTRDYPNDGIVAITPNSCSPEDSTSPNGDRAELGAITGDYMPNMPQAMANLHDKFWKVHRPFSAGELNFVKQAFDKPQVNKKAEEITIPMCCFFLFEPMNKFKSNNFNNGQLQSARFNPKTGYITLNIIYYE